MNLGTALQTLGARESGTETLQAAVTAFENALEEHTRDRVPLDWAMVQGNLSILYRTFFDKTGAASHLDKAMTHADVAKEVFKQAGASQYIGVIDNTIDTIAARRTDAQGG